MNDLLFILIDNGVETELEYAPDGWDDNFIILERSELFMALTRSYTVKLKYVKDGYSYLKNVFYNYGLKKTITLNIKKLKRSTMEYELIYTGDIDFNTFVDDGYSISVSSVESSVFSLIKQNYNEKFDIINDSTHLPLTDVLLPTNETTFATYESFKGVHISYVFTYIANKLLGGKWQVASGLGGGLEWVGGIYGGEYEIDTTAIDYSNIFICNIGTVGTSTKLAKMNISFKDIFEALDFGFGLGIDIVWTGSKWKLILKTKDDIFDVNTTYDFGDISDISINLYDKVFTNLKAGWNNSGNSDTFIPLRPPTYAPHPKPNPNSIPYFEVNKTTEFKYNSKTNKKIFEATSELRTDFSGFFDSFHSFSGNYDSLDCYIFNFDIDGLSNYYLPVDYIERRYLSLYVDAYTFNVSFSPRKCIERNIKYYRSLMNLSCDDLIFSSTEMTRDDFITYQYPALFTSEDEFSNIEITNDVYFKPVVFKISTKLGYDAYNSLKEPNTACKFTHKGIEYSGYLIRAEIKPFAKNNSTIMILSSSNNDLTNLI